jgi:uracil-DNA glycosylase
LEAELGLITPRVLVCPGSTTATTIFGAGARVLRDRGQARESKFAEKTIITLIRPRSCVPRIKPPTLSNMRNLALIYASH